MCVCASVGLLTMKLHKLKLQIEIVPNGNTAVFEKRFENVARQKLKIPHTWPPRRMRGLAFRYSSSPMSSSISNNDSMCSCYNQNKPSKVEKIPCHASWNDLTWGENTRSCRLTSVSGNAVSSPLCFTNISEILLKFCANL